MGQFDRCLDTGLDPPLNRAIRRGHRGVVTKLTNEAFSICDKDDLPEKTLYRLEIIDQQQETKVRILEEINQQILIVCKVDEIEQPQQVISAHMDELMKLPQCQSDLPASLRFVYDNISVHVRGLSALGVTAEQFGSLLIPVIMSKLPEEVARTCGT